MNDRFDLEQAISDVFTSNEELETLMYRIGDSPVTPSEDELLNMLIGIIELNKVRYEKLWNTFEALIANGVISNKNVEKLKKNGVPDSKIEGKQSSEWKLVDGIDVIVHIFHPEKRKFYELEKIWSELIPKEKVMI